MHPAARDRKKNEVLAAKIFGKDRRSSTPASKPATGAGSLASRAGVKKVCFLPLVFRTYLSNLC